MKPDIVIINRNMAFMVKNKTAPDSLAKAIEQVRNESKKFSDNWEMKNFDKTSQISEVAFMLIDHIVAEIRRHRDDYKTGSENWKESKFYLALQDKVGEIISKLTREEDDTFCSYELGKGSFPFATNSTELTLQEALNKLIHRQITAINFTIQPIHILFIVTQAGMGKPKTLCSINIPQFCDACDNVVKIINPRPPIR